METHAVKFLCDSARQSNSVFSYSAPLPPKKKADTAAYDLSFSRFFFCKKQNTTQCGTHQDTYELTRNHLEGLRRSDYLQRAHFLLAIERNMAHESGHIYHNVRRMPNVHPICVKAPDNVGIYTDHSTKVRYAISAREHVMRGSLELIDNVVCTNARMATDTGAIIPAAIRSQTIVDKLKEQLHRYRQVDQETTNPLTTLRTGISGVADRHGKVDASAKDDLAFAFTMCCGVVDGLRQSRYPYVSKDWLPDNC
jgi:hypothetical protein